jgi:hypothetical protein
MFRFNLRSTLSIVSLSLLLLSFQTTNQTQLAIASTSPCEAVNGDPGPPSMPPKPTLGGTVSDHADGSGISAASLKLYKCNAGVATLFSSAQTDSAGSYLFSDLEAGYFYYVEADLTGALSGMSAAGATENPSLAIGLSPSASGVDLSFED